MRWIAGMKDSSTKRLMYQVLFLTFFLQNALQKLLQFFFLSFYNFTKIEIKSFEYPKSIWKKILLGISDNWSMSHLSQRTSEPAYYIEDCRILVKYGSEEKGSFFCKCSILLGFIMSKKTKRFVISSSDKSSERNLSCFFDIIKPRRIEHLQKEEPFSSDPYFSAQPKEAWFYQNSSK